MKTMADIADEIRRKNKCDTCTHSIKFGGDGWSQCEGCIHDIDRTDNYKPATNADWIRSMSNEELEAFAKENVGLLIMAHCIDWLKQPYDGTTEALYEN